MIAIGYNSLMLTRLKLLIFLHHVGQLLYSRHPVVLDCDRSAGTLGTAGGANVLSGARDPNAARDRR